MIDLGAAVAWHALNAPQQIAVVYGPHSISYQTLDARVTQLAAALQNQGLARGQVLALLMRNSLAFIELSLAASRIGVVLLPINFRLAHDEVCWILAHAGARLLVADDDLAGSAEGFSPIRVADEVAQCDALRVFVPPAAGPGAAADAGAGPAADTGSGSPAQPDRRADLAGAVPSALQPPLQPDDLFRLMYTSGTTDRPKGVMHSYGNFYWKCLDHILALGLSAHDRLLVVGPLYHVGAFDLPGVAVLLAGGRLVVHRDFDPEAVLAAIDREGITGAWMAPVMLNRLLELPGRERFARTSLRWLVGGGERTPRERILAFSGLFPAARYIDAYGLTESCSGDTLMRAGCEIDKIGSTGVATPHVEISIRDEAGAALPAGCDGEICLRGPKVTRGYWRDPERTAACFHGDWFRTGDIGHLDADGFLFLTDRLKDMIISGGENIASSEVERVLYAFDGVSEAAVIGLPDARWGERVVAVVVPAPGRTLDAGELVRFCRTRLAGFKVPRQVVIGEALPRNPSGKVLKRVLRDQVLPDTE